MQNKIEREAWFEFSHSSGAGGQHINKNLTRAVICFQIDRSAIFTHEQKVILKSKLYRRISKDGVLRVFSEESRSQAINKRLALTKLVEVIKQALIKQKVRRKTKCTLGSKRRRLDNKRKRAEIKTSRSKHIEY